MIIARKALLEHIHTALARNPVAVLTGPRQSGKTTLARELLSEDSPNYFDLEDPVSLARLEEPRTALEPLKGLVVIDEVQRRPDLFPVLRVLADRRPSPGQFLILGSASGDLLRQSAETLAGRMERIEIGGFSLAELGADAADALWHRGSFPRAYLAKSEGDSMAWRKQFIQTLLERDFPQWGVRVTATALLRFWTMVGALPWPDLERGGASPRARSESRLVKKLMRHRDECLSKLLLFGEASLRRALRDFLAHYHGERNHQGNDNVLLFPSVSSAACPAKGPVVCRERLGGLLKYYYLQAA